VVDDYEPWRAFVSTTLRREPELEVVGNVSDGLESVQQAEKLQPDLVLLDIGLPTLNGIEAARRIREVSPTSKILFVSQNRSRDIAEEALRTGAGGYVVKSDAGSELLPAVKAVLEGERFISASLAGHDLVEPTEDQNDNPRRKKVVTPFRAQKKIRHEVEFYTDDTEFVDGFAHFIKTVLGSGNAVIVVATESHHAKLRGRLVADGWNVAAEIEQGSFVQLNVADTLSSFMVNDSPDPTLFRKLAGDLVTKAAKGAKGEHRRVAVCGEGVHILLAAGNWEATIKLESMWNDIAKDHDIDILCGYFRSAFASEESTSTLERVCAEHTAAHGRELCC
jgi:DNA-binding NarL/FixJ family response regulator